MCQYVMSDIHGRVDLLREVVENCVHFDKEDQLILLGDYVDGDEYSNSYETLQYIYNLQKKYPRQVIVLKGNHDEWLSHFVFGYKRILSTYVTPDVYTIQDFMTPEEYNAINTEAKRGSHNILEYTDKVVELRKKYFLDHHLELMEWLRDLPLYYETDEEVFVHAGINIIDGCNEYWKEVSTEDDFLMQFSNYPTDNFYKIIISGHIGTSSVKQNPEFHDICRIKNHIYIDSTVQVSKKLNVLKIDNHQYYQINKVDHFWITTPL